MTWAQTSWGLVCAELHAYLLPEYPDLVLGIGPDEWARKDATQRLLFLGPGMSINYQTIELLVPEETLEPPIKGAAPPGRRAICDRICPIVCMVASRYNGTEDPTTDTSPVACEDLYERLLAAINEKAHIRASEVQSARWFGSRAGANGSAVQVSFSLRFTVFDQPLARAKPTSTTVAGVSVANPSGIVVGTAVPGD